MFFLLVYCLVPPTIDHARHNALAEQTTFDLDSTLQYYCHTGYVTNGFPRAKCLAIDGQASWYGPDISCERKSFKKIYITKEDKKWYFNTSKCFCLESKK